LPRNHTMFRHTRKMVALRRSCPALKAGTTVWHEAMSMPCGFMAYSRVLPEQAATEVIVLINSGGGGDIAWNMLPLNDTIERSDGDWYVNVMNTSQRAQVQISQDGVWHLTWNGTSIPAGSSMVFVPEDQHLPFNDTLGIALCKGDSLMEDDSLMEEHKAVHSAAAELLDTSGLVSLTALVVSIIAMQSLVLAQ